MRWIAHRGNFIGPNPAEENKPEYVLNALKEWDVEVDVWRLDSGFYLGHDAPTYQVDRDFFRNSRIWTHCKNVAAFMELFKYPDVNCFLQEDDLMALTSRGYLWAHSNCPFYNDKTVMVLLDDGLFPAGPSGPYAICTDWIKGIDRETVRRLPFDLLIVDIDGIMTDGTKMYDREGRVFGKRYCDLDFTAIKRFQSAGVKVCFLSGDKTVNEEMAKTRKISFFHNSPGTDKVDMLKFIQQIHPSNNIAYVGDDYYDIGIMSAVNMSFCPQNSPAAVKRAAKHVVPVSSGSGVLAKIYDMFEDQIPYVFPKDSPDVNPK